ncbi:MAG TPA: DUF4350 domain-containing protein [Clostridia bacterium]
MKIRSFLLRFATYLGAALFLLIIGLYVYGDQVKEKYTGFSSSNSGDEGTKALYLLTEQMGFDAARYERPARFLPDDSTLVLVAPDAKRLDNKREKEYLISWIKKGNSLILIDSMKNLTKYNIESMGLKNPKNIDKEDNSAEYDAGKGKFVFLEESAKYTNSGLKENNDNAVGFISELDSLGHKKVLFNEYYHGQGAEGTQLSDLLGDTGTLIVLQLFLALLIFIVLKSRRVGRPVQELRIIKRQENENLFALSALYNKAGAHSHILYAYMDFFKRSLSRFLGFNSIPDDTELESAILGNKYLCDNKIPEVMKSANFFIQNQKNDIKTLLKIFSSLEKVRKGIRK